jgi:hypothetical protein
VHVAGGVLDIAKALRAALVSFEPALHSGTDCATFVEELAATEKACAAARARAAARVAECGVHKDRGFGDATEWLARTAGTSAPEAKRAMETAAGLEALPDVAGALVAGELSLAQAHELVAAEAECPGSSHELLDVARDEPLSVLKDKARKKRLEAADADELHTRQLAARTIRHWRDELGMVCGRFALAPEVGIPFVNRLDAETDRVRRRARQSGNTEARDAHAADAFALMVEGAGRGRATSIDVVFVCDLRAYRRGHAHSGEPCHIIGGGPVPVSVVREQLGRDAFVKAVLHDGVEIHTVKHYGRHIPAELRTALQLGAPPDLDGVRCVDGCGRRYGLEWDHDDPRANGGPTSLRNLKPRCKPDHWAKTERDRKAGLLNGGHEGDEPP